MPVGIEPEKLPFRRLSTPVAALTPVVDTAFCTAVAANAVVPKPVVSRFVLTLWLPFRVEPAPLPKLKRCPFVADGAVAAFETVTSVPTP